MTNMRLARTSLATSVLATLAACGLTLDAGLGSDDPTGDGAPPVPTAIPDAVAPDPAGPDATADAPVSDATSEPEAEAEAGPPCSLAGTLRDFRAAHETNGHPDFESYFTGVQLGLVLSELDVEGKPIRNAAYVAPDDASPGTSLTSDESFRQWFRDTPDVNCTVPYTIPLELVGPGVLAYRNAEFFPMDGQCFGTYAETAHDYHFTYELRGRFVYHPGAYLRFTGDDDIWVFVDRKLRIDLGGVHGPTPGAVNLDADGLADGSEHDFAFFFAERRTVQSNFDFETNFAFEGCGAAFGDP